MIGRDGVTPEHPIVEREAHVLPAASPEEIAAWDVWAEELKGIRELLIDVWKSAEVAATASSAIDLMPNAVG